MDFDVVPRRFDAFELGDDMRHADKTVRALVLLLDVRRDGYRTAKGAHVGSTEAEIRRLYPAIEVEAHPYDPGGHYLRLASRDRRYGMIFETDGAKVTDFRSGWVEPVGYVEGCL
jgi:hypothetical protein